MNDSPMEDKRTKNMKMTGWFIILFVVIFISVRVFVSMAAEILAIVLLVPSSPWEGPDPRMLDEFVQEKMRPVTVAAEEGLEAWREVHREFDDGNVRRKEINDMMGKITSLQESFSKSKSIGSLVGLNSVDLEDRMTSLKDNQEMAVQLIEEVNKKAQEMVEAHEDRDRATEAVGDPNEEQRTIQKLRDMLGGVLDISGIKDLGRRLEAAGQLVDGKVDIEEAQEIVARLAERAGEKVDLFEVSNAEIERIVKEIMLSKIPTASDGGEICLPVATATEHIRAVIGRFLADRTGIPDYAMGPAGASVIFSLTSETFEESSLTSKLSLERLPVTGPSTAIDPVSGLGNCWPMKGSSGRLTVKLSQPVRVSSISIEHAPRVLLLNEGSSALKVFSVIGYPRGWVIGPDTVGHSLVSDAEYRLDGDDIQFFNISEEYRGVEYGAVALHVESNHGEERFTCLYRLRVHGTPASTYKFR